MIDSLKKKKNCYEGNAGAAIADLWLPAYHSDPLTSDLSESLTDMDHCSRTKPAYLNLTFSCLSKQQ